MNADSTDISSMQKYLACPKCHADIRISDQLYRCLTCGDVGQLRDNVFLARPLDRGHYFDDLHEVMQEGNETPEIREMCYSKQSDILEEMIRPGDVVVDIGCGPAIHFEKPCDCVLIGVDPSFNSIRANSKLDIRVCGNAESMPLRDRSVDRISLFYSIHHMIGQTQAETRANVTAALRECGRVIREGGTVVVFDMSPWWPAWQAERLVWNRARKALADKLDMFFWRESALQRLASAAFSFKQFEARNFSVSPFLVFPPVFSLPGLKVPRFLYPFDIKMYKWSF